MKIATSNNSKKTYAWAQGNNYYEEICRILNNPAFQTTTSWLTFCEFSKTFTNMEAEDKKKTKYGLLYMDDSCGFKTRGAWKNEITTKSLFLNKEVEDPDFPQLRKIKPAAELSIPHQFGAWNAYYPEDESIFMFKSCNGNTLIGFVRKTKVEVFSDKRQCRYSIFFSNEKPLLKNKKPTGEK